MAERWRLLPGRNRLWRCARGTSQPLESEGFQFSVKWKSGQNNFKSWQRLCVLRKHFEQTKMSHKCYDEEPNASWCVVWHGLTPKPWLGSVSLSRWCPGVAQASCMRSPFPGIWKSVCSPACCGTERRKWIISLSASADVFVVCEQGYYSFLGDHEKLSCRYHIAVQSSCCPEMRE